MIVGSKAKYQSVRKECLEIVGVGGGEFCSGEDGGSSDHDIHAGAAIRAGEVVKITLNWKMESVDRAAVTTDCTDYTDFTERIGLEIAVRKFTFRMNGHRDIIYSKSV